MLRAKQKIHANYATKLIQAPKIEPVSAAELAIHLNGCIDDFDRTELNELISSTRLEIERNSDIAMISQTWIMSLDAFPSNEPWWDGVKQGAISELKSNYTSIKLTKKPVQSLSLVTAYDNNDNDSDITDHFRLDNIHNQLHVKSGYTLPPLRNKGGIEFTYIAGYGDAPEDVPEDLKLAVKQLATFYFSSRGDCPEGTNAYKASGAMRIVSNYR